MIPITSQPTPEALARLSDLEKRRVKLLAEGKPLTPVVAEGYRDKNVKQAIVAETNGKCAYCESDIRHISWGDVEHILPKSKYPDKMLQYDNLTFACNICNGNKSDYDDKANPLLNPYEDDPDSFLVACGFLVWHRPGKLRGETTIEVLKLNRMELNEKREKRLKEVKTLADRYETLPPGQVKLAIRDQLFQEAEAEAEYSFVVKAYLTSIGLSDSTSNQD